jgi:hypothetical protein
VGSTLRRSQKRVPCTLRDLRREVERGSTLSSNTKRKEVIPSSLDIKKTLNNNKLTNKETLGPDPIIDKPKGAVMPKITTKRLRATIKKLLPISKDPNGTSEETQVAVLHIKQSLPRKPLSNPLNSLNKSPKKKDLNRIEVTESAVARLALTIIKESIMKITESRMKPLVTILLRKVIKMIEDLIVIGRI